MIVSMIYFYIVSRELVVPCYECCARVRLYKVLHVCRFECPLELLMSSCRDGARVTRRSRNVKSVGSSSVPVGFLPARRYASTGTSHGRVFVSVTSRCSIETAERI